MSTPATPNVPDRAPPRDAVVEQLAEARATHWTLDARRMLVLQGVLDRRTEECLSAVTRSARHACLPLEADLSAVTRISVDILALLLEAHADPGLLIVEPLPTCLLTLMDMTGTSDVFTPEE